jgi:hypothetical protein
LEFRLDQLQTLMAERVSICTGVPVKQVICVPDGQSEPVGGSNTSVFVL